MQTAMSVALATSVLWATISGCGGGDTTDAGLDAAAMDGGRTDVGGGVDAPPDVPPDAGSCARNDECADGLFCNGSEICSATGRCVAGAAPCSNPLAPGTCSEESDFCEAECPVIAPLHHRPGHACPPSPGCVTHSDCDDGDPCNGLEFCTPGLFTADACGCWRPGTAPPPCTADAECDDGTFCNGVERCGGAGVSCLTCVPAATGPCGTTGLSCDESLNRCFDPGCIDADADGHLNLRCGDDCDDADPTRYPGRAEVCDDTGHDEDCDPMTFGARDGDGDGWVDQACCNTNDADGTVLCGPDCNDAAPATSPVGTESCNGSDDDCDGLTDEGLRVFLYSDLDGDGHGYPTCLGEGCPGAPGSADVGDDCDDTNAAIHPGTQSCGPNGGLRRCEPGGFFSSETPCPGDVDCHPQPDGTGLCL